MCADIAMFVWESKIYFPRNTLDNLFQVLWNIGNNELYFGLKKFSTKLAKLVICNCFQDEFYLQVKSTAMGGKMAPNYACL